MIQKSLRFFTFSVATAALLYVLPMTIHAQASNPQASNPQASKSEAASKTAPLKEQEKPGQEKTDGKKKIARLLIAPEAVPVSGLLPFDDSRVDLVQLDINIRPDRVTLSYSLQNTTDEKLEQKIKFPLPRISKALVNKDPAWAQARQFSSLLGPPQIRSNRERVTLKQNFKLLLGETDVTPKDDPKVNGKNLAELMARLTSIAVLEENKEPFRNNVELAIDLYWTEVFQPGEVRNLTLSYRPYSGSFPFFKLAKQRSNRTLLRNWQQQLDLAFCTTATDNSGAAELITGSDERGWLQTSVLSFDKSHDWGKPIAEFSLSVDPNMYNNEGKRIINLKSFPSFCEKQGSTVDETGVVTRTWQNMEVVHSIPILFAFSPKQDAIEEMNNLLKNSRLFDVTACTPANGWILPCSDMRALTINDVRHLSADALYFAQLEISARKGAHFEDASVRRHFERFAWYEPFSDNPPLSAIEKDNSRLLQQVRLDKLGLSLGPDSNK